MKKRFILLLSLALTAILALSTIGYAGEETPIPEPEVLDFVTTKTIKTKKLFDFDLEFEKMSDSFLFHDADHKGTTIFIDYTTDAYDNGVTYDKWCRVYLPYGYDQEDTETRYNVIYFQHGNNGSPNEFFDHTYRQKVGYGDKNIFDNMMDPEYGVMEPCIIVCPTYYFNSPRDDWRTPVDGDQSAGDGHTEGIPGNYYREIVEDLIPAVEGQLNTYLEDPSEEGIIASRDHRLWSGYSRGGACTWNTFYHDLPYFKYWMPMSASCIPEGFTLDEGMGGESDLAEEAYQYLKEGIEANQEYDFFIFTTNGGKNDIPAMVSQMQYFLAQEDGTFSYGLDPDVNNFYYTCTKFDHNDMWMPFTLFNAIDILFNGEITR